MLATCMLKETSDSSGKVFVLSYSLQPHFYGQMVVKIWKNEDNGNLKGIYSMFGNTGDRILSCCQPHCDSEDYWY